jgi:exopolysaccharide biosynthesis polyprenyl glycosylphosphotransferase
MYDVRVRRELAHRRFVVSLVRQTLRIVSLHALDGIATLIAFLVARGMLDVALSVRAAPALIAFVLLGLNVRGSYRAGNARRDGERLVTGVIIGLVLIAIVTTIPGELKLSAQFVAIFGLAAIGALIAERRIVDAIVHAAYMRGYGLRRALLVARSHEVRDLLDDLVPKDADGRPEEDQVVVGHITPDPMHDPNSLGTLGDIERILEERDISELLVTTTLKNEKLAEVAEACFDRGVRLLVIPPAAHALSGWAELTRVGNWPAYQLHPARLELPALVLKRATDLALASAGFVIAVPLMTLIAIAIRVESRGPVFFRQRRVGLGGREFMMWKFRSMYHEAEAMQKEIAHLNPYGDSRLFKLPRDPRITRVGRMLRRFSLDELPQLFNILAGDMSLVGPRPPLPSEVNLYESRHYIRLSVVPGLTGPWQVNGRNLITDFEEVVRLEREYIERWSLRSDMEIIFKTLGVVISGEGAY